MLSGELFPEKWVKEIAICNSQTPEKLTKGDHEKENE